MKKSVVISLCVFVAALLTLGGCRTHKELVKKDSVGVQHTQQSQSLLLSHDSTAVFDSLSVEMLNVKIFVFPSDSNTVAHGGPSAAQDSCRSAGLFSDIIASQIGNIAAAGGGLILSADKISVTNGRSSIDIHDSRCEKRDSSSQDSTRIKTKEKVSDKPSSGWSFLWWIMGPLVFFAIAFFIYKYRKVHEKS